MLEKRSVGAEALARVGGWDRKVGELDSMRVDDLRVGASFQ
jgi:hypothetical protein